MEGVGRGVLGFYYKKDTPFIFGKEKDEKTEKINRLFAIFSHKS